MARKPLGFFKVPPNYAQMPEEEQLAIADAIGETMRAALLVQEADIAAPADDEESRELGHSGNENT